MGRFRRLFTLGGLLILALPACGVELEHGYVQSSDGSLSLRHPSHWTDLELEATGTEWLAGIDGSPQPAQENFSAPVVAEPFLVVQVLPLQAEVRDEVSLDSLYQVALVDRSQPLNADDPNLQFLVDETFLDDRGFHGHHLRFEVQNEEGVAVEEHLMVFNPDRTSLHRVWITCSADCFEAHSDDIAEVFESVRLRDVE